MKRNGIEPDTMKRNTLMLALLTLAVMLPQMAWAVLTPGEYYIYNDFFRKPLNGAQLADYAAASDADYIFVAEATGTTGYVRLKQKSTGKYLVSSTDNQWSVLLTTAGTGDQYLWSLEQRYSTRITNKRNTGSRLGCDFNNGNTYYWSQSTVPVYYNKGQSAMNWWSVYPANGQGFEASRLASHTDAYDNEYGQREQDDYQVTAPVQVQDMDYHIIGSTPFAGSGTVNLTGEHSWLVFENNRPSNVRSTWLRYVTIQGQPAQVGTNCRVEIWLRGAVVIPLPSGAPFVGHTARGDFEAQVGCTADLGENSNEMRSFTLRRGYMVTLASGKNCGYDSRVYVADHQDLEVTLPQSLDRRVSSLWVRPWHYTAKSGYGGWDTSAAKTCGSSWYWNWDANQSSSEDLEYIPIKQHRYWPGNGNFWNNSYTAMMMYNEPEHSEQHNKCSCGGTISAWTAYEGTREMNTYGLRIGSPSATDLNYIKEYLQNCHNMKQRVDFSCTHGYWTGEWANNLNILSGYGYPIWVTEWEYGASWTTSYIPSSADEYAGRVLGVLDQMEYNRWVERYAYYGTDLGGTNGWMRELFWDANYQHGNAPTGDVLTRIKPHFSYDASVQHVPNWWAPGFQDVTVTRTTLQDGKYTLQVSNPNGDATGTLSVMSLQQDGTWQQIYSVEGRAQLEQTKLAITLPMVGNGDQVKVVVTYLYDASNTKESGIVTLQDYRDMATLQNLRFDEGVSTSTDVTTGSTDQMKAVTGWAIQSTSALTYRAGAQFTYADKHKLNKYDMPAFNSEGTATGGALGVNAAWNNTACYTQNVVLQPGIYTLTVPVYNANGTTAVAKNLIGFVADDGTEYLASTTSYATGKWTTETVQFVLAQETLGHLSLGYKGANTTSTNMPKLFFDYVDLQLLTPQEVDYTSMAGLRNLTFDTGDFVQKNIVTYAKDVKNEATELAQVQEVQGWTIQSNGDARAAGQLAWGNGNTLGGSEVLDEGADGVGVGGCLGIVAVWTASTQYTQAVTLPAGHYTITIPYYNAAGTGKVNANLCGFITDAGKKYCATETTFSVGAWGQMQVTFDLPTPTQGKLSLGYTAADAGSGSMPHLFIDEVQIQCWDRHWPTQGDADFDGQLSIRDVPEAVSTLLGLPGRIHAEVLNVRRDGALDYRDIEAIVRLLLK